MFDDMSLLLQQFAVKATLTSINKMTGKSATVTRSVKGVVRIVLHHNGGSSAACGGIETAAVSRSAVAEWSSSTAAAAGGGSILLLIVVIFVIVVMYSHCGMYHKTFFRWMHFFTATSSILDTIARKLA